MKVLSVRLTLFSLIILFSTISGFSQQTNVNGPTGSIAFGQHVVALSNGNFVVTDPNYSIPGGAQNIGAAFLYNGATKELISVLTGSSPNDYVGYHGVTALPNGNYVVISKAWKKDGNTFGAITFCNGFTGISGEVSENNSLTGSFQSNIADAKITVLTNGNYVVSNPHWGNNGVAQAGAVTFGNGTTGISGVISETNSLIGSNVQDNIGSGEVIALTNGNYVVSSPRWKNGTIVSAGAVTFGNGKTGVAGIVSAANSLIGLTPFDQVGLNVTALTNGNYVVSSRSWDNGIKENVGAATFGNGETGISGAVSVSNSLVGIETNDFVGEKITALTNGNYVVNSPYYTSNDIGAVTFGNGTTGISGVILESNSLLGSTSYDQIGSDGVTALTNGNYVISSPFWSNGLGNWGAVTFANGTTGILGRIFPSNSLVGLIGQGGAGWNGGVTALTNGNYVVRSPNWSNGLIEQIGAVTFGNGQTGISGVISESNSLVGSLPYDNVGFNGVIALTNGNYVVRSFDWNKSNKINDAGAVTFANGTTGITGEVSESNSLIGSKSSDQVGYLVKALTNGNYVVGSYYWDNELIRDAGAVTFGNGTTGVAGVVSSSNSLIGSSAADHVGLDITALPNGNYVVWNRLWDNGSIENAGAVTYLNGSRGFSGILTSQNSVLGTTEQGGNSLNYSFDAINNQLIVGRPADNLVTIVAHATGFVNVAGKVQTSTGRDVARAIVSMTDSGGQIRTSITNQFGYYQFANIAAGENYTFNVSAKGHSFAPQILSVSEDIKNLNFRAQ